MSYLSVTDLLKEKNLIKSKFFYKLHIKLIKPTPLTLCNKNLTEKMGIRGVVKTLNKECSNSAIMITIPEGRHLAQIAGVAEKVTNNKKDDLMKVWNSEQFVNDVIEKYDFISNDIKKQGIRYPLEGYFFPSTYELASRDVTPEYIAFKMLDQMQVIYNKYKTEIEKSDLSFHEILTLASIVEYEAILDEDRPVIAGVFYNRLKREMLFGSCATIGYAINNWKTGYTKEELAVDSLYNTYKHPGLPIGPGNMPSEKSLIAVLYPTNTEFLYFLAKVNDEKDLKTYYSYNYEDHKQKCIKYLGYEC